MWGDKTDKALHAASIAAGIGSVATAADLTFCGGLGTACAAALSLKELRKSDPGAAEFAERFAEALDAEMNRAVFDDDRKKIVAQMLLRFQPSDNDLAEANKSAKGIVALMRVVIENRDRPDDYNNETALGDLESVMIPALSAALEAQSFEEARDRVLLERTAETRDEVTALRAQLTEMQAALVAQAETSGRYDALRDEGITDKAIIRLAQRIASETEDLGQAWLELQNAMDIAVKLSREGETGTNHPDFVDTVLRRAAARFRSGDTSGALAEVEAALAEADAQKLRLLESGVEYALLDGDTAKAAELLVAWADLEAGGVAGFEDLRALQETWYVRGRDKGINLDLEVAIDLARLVLTRVGDAHQRGTSGNDLGAALQTLGERESGTDRLEAAVTAFEAALKERARDRAPLDWAMTQMNLGNALATVGERESGTDRLEAAVAAYQAALEERTRDRVPLDWAMTQMNLGTALRTLGERESGTDRLEAAVAAFEAALEERTRDRVPLDWAQTQMNLGNALWTLGQRESGTDRLKAAVAAYEAALEEWTRDRVPLQWAMTQMNLGNALATLGQRESGTDRLEAAVAAYQAALEERTRDRVPLDWAQTQMNLGAALQTLGERESGIDRLEAAVAAFEAALEEWTRDRVPLGWAQTQMNLGNALQTLGEREGGTDRLEAAVAAYEAALEVFTRDRVPLQWAMVQGNLANVEMALFGKTSEAARLDSAEGHVNAARDVFEEAGASQYLGMADRILARIAALRDGAAG